jgi:brefeldin A-inhibited guanine nucleotide-exchange protein
MMEIAINNHSGGLRSRDGNIESHSTPRVFSLQKLVEVADCNMHVRARLDWRNMWNLLADHFTLVGCHDNHALAMYAIDSLKQLSIKFLQKEELSNFNFQRLFLKPFEVIMTKSKYFETKELILGCLDIMILACANNIRSGWRSIFAVFSVAANYDRVEIARMAFAITERLMTQQFNLLIFDFVELMNCLVSFVKGPHTTISIAALSHLYQCAEHLAHGTVEPALGAQYASSETAGTSWEKSKGILSKIEEDAAVFRLWWPLLLGLSTEVSNNRLEIRTKALDTLHKVLRTYGDLFSTQTWEVIFKGVLFPMMDSAKTDSVPQPISSWPTQNPVQVKDSTSWISTTASTAITVCISLYSQYAATGLTTSLLADVIGMFEECISSGIESFARMSLSGLCELLVGFKDSNDKITDNVADLITERLSSLVLRHLWLDFGEAGNVVLDKKTSPVVQDLLNYRHYSKTGSADIESDVNEIFLDTPFGPGQLVKTVSAYIL